MIPFLDSEFPLSESSPTISTYYNSYVILGEIFKLLHPDLLVYKKQK